MGREITQVRFDPVDYTSFRERVEAETRIFETWWREGQFDRSAYMGGFELEAWLVDRECRPFPENEAYLKRLASPLVVPELARFNVELNGTPQRLAGRALRTLEDELVATWQRCQKAAQALGGALAMIGILPTVRERDLTLRNISPLNRYYALNEQVLKRRGGRPIKLEIAGRERLALTHEDVMLEAGATSFQVHLQVPADELTRCFNASLVLAAPLVALSANSPYLFEHDLWDETRIPLFEQAVDTGDAVEPGEHRVTFGSGYLESGPRESFVENLERYPVLLPAHFDSAPEELCHMSLHNGTIWRWNRLLLGFSGAGVPHVRIEHRVMPAGPTIIDMMANAAVYFGAVRALAGRRVAPEAELSFEAARTNFYAAARDGLAARFAWLDGRKAGAAELLEAEILPLAREGLLQYRVDPEDVDRYLGLAAARVRKGQNGTAWQRAFIAAHGRHFSRLTAAYLEHQGSGRPVHEWPI
ncbi:MAG: glutamate--cysteine ligase [Betaproteobacteria bacterium]|nr:glutamate--cysteine ligase [Betaproteobacteria bacterium]MDH3436723.1 glutamate--cysteine ligase [Betaproteobacteria bacterium]